MKLFTHYSRINILASILAVLLGSIGYYFMIRGILVHELDDALKVEEAEILSLVREKDQLPEPSSYRDQQIGYAPAAIAVRRQFLSISRQESRHHDESRPFRQLLFPVTVKGQLYTVTVTKSEEETEDLLEWIMLVTGGMILILLGILFVANRLLLRRIWQPFYQTLEGLRGFDLSGQESIVHTPTSIEEFRHLQTVVEQMTKKIRKDYEMLRDFTDNASHEMQTPLAIINSKLDLMIQDQQLEEKHHRQLQAMYDAVSRLRQLNQSLLLLTKIENNQFAQSAPLALEALIEKKLIQLEDPIRVKHLTITTDVQPCRLQMNAYLMDILLNNILGNAIRHNFDQGTLDIVLREELLQVSNTGGPLSFDPAAIFDRFTKGGHSEGTGLGLAIVRQICDNYGFILTYSYLEGLHMLHIQFKPSMAGTGTGGHPEFRQNAVLGLSHE
ncbi:MAG TPA: HAMP domain-containing sensor histidine kinase [Puia sp.]|nr:HAMP domain-containing sensor histidine kinase [Puia sp.]